LIQPWPRLPALITEKCSPARPGFRAHEIAGGSERAVPRPRRHFPIAMKGALKLKELSYIHCRGLCAGEMKHGPSPSSTRTCRSSLWPRTDELFDKTASNLEEAAAGRAR